MKCASCPSPPFCKSGARIMKSIEACRRFPTQYSSVFKRVTCAMTVNVLRVCVWSYCRCQLPFSNITVSLHAFRCDLADQVTIVKSYENCSLSKEVYWLMLFTKYLVLSVLPVCCLWCRRCNWRLHHWRRSNQSAGLCLQKHEYNTPLGIGRFISGPTY